jgi:phosphate transport system substrate-binding protein
VKGRIGDRDFTVEIRAHGSEDAFRHLADGSTDIGMASRPIKPEEKTPLAALGDMSSPDNEHVIALDGIAVIVAPGNGLTTISKQNLAKVFAGEITDWSRLGSGNGAIQVYARDEKSGTYDTFKHLVPNSDPLVTNARRFEDSTALEAALSNDPAGIGFVALPYVKTTHVLSISDGMKSIALSPTVFTIKKEDYALTRRLYLYTAANPANQYVRQFVKFAQSDAGQQVVKSVGFVGQNLNIPEARQNQSAAPVRSCELSSQWPGAVDSYCKLIAGKTDLGTNFRFISGSSTLDNRAVQDMQRVLKVMSDNPNNHLTLIGFADAQGDFRSNRVLSESRANAVKSALQTLGISNVDVYGFGPEIPVGNNDTPEGRERNRRVEIWVN